MQVGCVVTVKDDSGEDDTFTLVGSTEANPFEGRYSLDSPLGRAVLGHKTGDTVTVAAPDGEIKYTIVTVNAAHARSKQMDDAHGSNSLR